MNLVEDPWIPVIFRDGGRRLVSLRACLTDPGIVDLAVRPHERVALMRLLLCLVYAIFDVPGERAWRGLAAQLPERAAAYLNAQKMRFNLFDPQQPFLQVAGLKCLEGSSGGRAKTAKLDFALASGNNSTLFDHEAQNEERRLSPPELALALLTYQHFSLAGIIGAIVWQTETARSSSDAPCSPSSMLHAFLRGPTLRETLQLNLIPRERLQRRFQALREDWIGRPIWERFPKAPTDEAAVENATLTFLGRMVPLSRAILLDADGKEMLLGNGLSYPSFSNPQNSFPAEVTATVILRGEGGQQKRALLGVRPGKAIWRELHALTVKDRAEDDPQGCLALGNLTKDTGFDLLVAALARDKADVIDAVESVYHVPAQMLDEPGRKTYEGEVRRAEGMARALGYAITRYRTAIDGGFESRLKLAGPKKNGELTRLQAKALLKYWTALEKRLPVLFQMVRLWGQDGFMAAQTEWGVLLREQALEAYTQTCGQNTSRQMRAFVAGKSALFMKAKNLLEESEDSDAEPA